MKIQLFVVGKTTDRATVQLIDRYVSRIGHYCSFEYVELPDARRRTTDVDVVKRLEGETILSKITNADRLVLLDERGRQYTSREFAATIENAMVTLPRNLVYVIGGPFGFSQAVYDRADAMLSLSKMTFPHELIRPFIVEQIYRAFTIMRGEKYHHD